VRDTVPATPVILLVSPDCLDAAVGILRRGADDYLVRGGVTPERLVCAVRHALLMKHTEMALERVERVWREIGRSLHEGVLVVDPEGTMVFASARLGEILGYPADMMPGVSVLAFVDPVDMPRAKALLGPRSRDRREEVELRLRRSDGEAIDARLAASPVTGGNGEYLGTVMGVADITEQNVAGESVRRRNVQLDVINRVVRTATSSAGMGELPAGILEKILTLLGFDGGGVYLIGPGRSRANWLPRPGFRRGSRSGGGSST
jgi:PAS domain S-box-containing protein